LRDNFINWYSVKDKIPKEDEKILVLWASGTDGPEIFTASWSMMTGWYICDFQLPNRIYITYWSNLPSTPDKWYE